MSRKPILLAAAMAAGLVLAAPSVASADCYSSASQLTAFTDAYSDGESGLAPEIGTVRAGTDASCRLVVDAGVLDAALVRGDSVFIYIDTDSNPATGLQSMNGADWVVGTVGSTTGQPATLAAPYDPAQGNFDFNRSAAVAVDGRGGFSAPLSQFGIANPATIMIRVGTMYSGLYGNYTDWAPEVGQAPAAFPLAFSTVAPPPPNTQVTPPPTTQVTPPPSTKVTTQGCVVPKTKGMTTARAKARLRAAGCRIGKTRTVSSSVRRGRVTATSVRVGVRTTKRVDLKVSGGKSVSARVLRADSPPAQLTAQPSARRFAAAEEALRPHR